LPARDWYIAWLDSETEAFNPVAHAVIDVPQASVSLSEEEGVDAVTVTVKRDALPSAGYASRSWAMLSWEGPDNVVHPMCRMRLAKRPLGQTDAVTDLTFLALPSDFVARRSVVLAAMKTLPVFDPVLVDPDKRDDPKEILDGHQRIAHFDRVTQAFTTPSILGVGAPFRTFGPQHLVGWPDGGGVAVRQTETPLAGVRIILTSEWLQRFDGPLDATNAIKGLFPSGFIETLSGEEIERAWFKPGASVNGVSGYTVIKSKLIQVSTPAASPKKMGPVRGMKARYNYVDDPDLLNPRGMGLPVQYYDLELSLHYGVSQKRVERVEILVLNAGAAAEDGEIRTLELKTQDVSLDDITPQFVGPLYYPAGAIVLSGSTPWICLVGHLSKDNFSADLSTIVGGVQVPQWDRLDNDQSPIGGADRDTYYQTARGEQTIRSAVLKAMRLLAEASRCVEVEFSVPLQFAWDMSTTWRVRLELDDTLIPGGWCEGKVTRFEISDPSRADFARAIITIKCAAGSGQAPSAGTGGGVAYTAEPWDIVELAAWGGQQPQPYPQPGGAAVVINDRAAQLAYIQANDYQRGVAGRNDRTANDPKNLLKQVTTNIVLSLVDLSPRPDMTNVIFIPTSGWSGPRQIQLPE
jgi:hypothetical protein